MPAPLPSAPVAADSGVGRLRGRLMQASLKAVLDHVAGSREVLPHLAALETALGRDGSDAIDRVPHHWLAKICAQLSRLPLPDDDPPLQDLLSRLLRALEKFDARKSRQFLSTFTGDGRVLVREISEAEFAEAAREQAGPQRGDA
jgi:hypothetical protein